MILGLVLINAIIVILIDLLDVPTTFLFKPLWKIFTKLPYNGWHFKPFSCSLCSSWWAGLIYIIVINQFSLLNVFIVLIMAYFNFIITDAIILVKTIINKLNELIIKKLYE